jgi:hypothetical protein
MSGESIKDKLPDGIFLFVDNSVNQTNYISYYMTQRDENIWDGRIHTLLWKAARIGSICGKTCVTQA